MLYSYRPLNCSSLNLPPSRDIPLASVTRRMWRSKAGSPVHINASDASVSQSPPSIQLSGPLVAQPTLPLNGEQSASGLQRLELAQAEHKQAVRQSKKDRLADSSLP